LNKTKINPMPKTVLTIKSRRLFAFITAFTLVFQSVILGGIFGGFPAYASTATYNFTTPAEYTVTDTFAIHGGTAHFKIDWADVASSIPSVATITDLISPASAGLVWSATGDVDGAYKSINYGGNWNNISINADFIPDDFEVTLGDAGANAVNLFVGGSDTVAGAYAYSTNNGTNWTYNDTALVGAQNIVSVAHKSSATSYTWVFHRDGAISRTEDIDVITIWAFVATPFADARQLLWDETNGLLIASGGDLVDGKVSFSNDNGDSWTSATLPGSPPVTIDKLGYSNGYLYVGGSGYVAVGDVSAGLNNAGSWTDVSANINSGNFTAVTEFLNANEVMLVSVDATTGIDNGQVYSTLNDGTNWLTHGVATAATMPGPLTRLYSNGQFLWGVDDDVGSPSTYVGDFDTDSASVVTTVGISVATLSAIDITYNSASEEDNVGVALGFGVDPAGTWYYHDGGAWTSVVGGDYTNANIEAQLDTNLGTFDDEVAITGDIYLKIYSKGTVEGSGAYIHDLFLIDNIDVTYTAGTLAVTSPNGAETWVVGSTHDITWTSTGFGAGNIIDIDYYSPNNGGGWNSIIANTANDGSYTWTLPNDQTNQALVRVSSGSVTDSSDAVFTIYIPIRSPDENDPASQVDALPQYKTSSSFNVSATASDNVGVQTVSLYYRSDQSPTIQLWDTDNSAPFVFNFTSPHGNGLYQFYSGAVDFSGNDNWPEKLIAGPIVEASTTVDTFGPYITTQAPYPNQTEVAITQDIIVEFSEPMNTGTFGYQLYEQNNPTKPVTIISTTWSNSDTKLTVKHANFSYKTWYTFHAVTATDKAGNILLEGTPGGGWGMGIEVYYPEGTWDFETAPKRDPDLTSSTIEVSDGTHAGKYLPSETAHYTITLRNTSDLPANNVQASLTVSEGIKIVSGSITKTGGTIQIHYAGLLITGFTWSGTVIKGTNVIIRFNATVNTPANILEIEQGIAIDDNVNEMFQPAPAVIHIAKNPDFTASTKTVDKPEAVPGTLLEYNITIVHQGNTVVDALTIDNIPTNTTYVNGSLTGDTGWQTLQYNPVNNQIQAQAQMLSNFPSGRPWEMGVPEDDEGWIPTTLQFSFWVSINNGTEGEISNTATVSDPDVPGSSFTTDPPAVTLVPGDSTEEKFSPQIVNQSPDNGSFSAPLKGTINAQFSKSIKTDTLTYSVNLDGYPVDTTGWQDSWSQEDKLWTLTPAESLEVGAPYEVEISYAEDTDGNVLVDGPLPNPWSFTTVDPVVTITSPSELLVELVAEQISPVFTVTLKDALSGQTYTAEENTTIGLGAWLGGTPRTAGVFLLQDGSNWRYVTSITLTTGQSQAQFYYRDSNISDPDYITITAYENPSQGWGDAEKNAIVRGDAPPADHLIVNIDTTLFTTSQFSPPMAVQAQDQTGKFLRLPEILYFYTSSDTGRFYDANHNVLPEWLTIQGFNPTTNLQYSQPGATGSATFYYWDITPGAYLVTIADQAPLTPDTGFRNVSAVFNVANLLEEEELLEELEEVEDETGRVLAEVTVEPTETTLLPGEKQTFTAKAYDEDGKEIENVIFRWYVLAGGGTILKTGSKDGSHGSVFTAGQKPGIYYDTILVATLYNGKINYATAGVTVTDIVEYGGPARLPTTGISGLQLILLALTLLAAVALAWVEHYDKTHFREESNE